MTGNELRTLSVKGEVNHIRFGFPRVLDQRLIESADGQHSESMILDPIMRLKFILLSLLLFNSKLQKAKRCT